MITVYIISIIASLVLGIYLVTKLRSSNWIYMLVCITSFIPVVNTALVITVLIIVLNDFGYEQSLSDWFSKKFKIKEFK